jgi:formylmethanofuran dehydrogenase subunit E-like metal-binding protein
METFKIEVKETLLKTVEIEANSTDEAISIIKELYEKQEIVLGSEHYIATDIDITSFHSIENNTEFSNYVLKNAEEMLANLSIEELSKIAFGNYSTAMSNFNSKRKDS